MRPSNKSRSRNKPGGSQNNQRRGGGGGNMGNVTNRVFESAGPDGKVRGTPQQIIDKYQALARDAQLSGDRVIAENYLQHSEHYSRLLGEATRQQNEQRAAQQEREESQQPRSDRSGNDRDDDQGDQENRGGQQNRDAQPPREQQSRDQQNRDQQPRERQSRSDPRGSDDQPSGLTTIDASGDEDVSGPIETPEGSRRNGRPSQAARRVEEVPESRDARPAPSDEASSEVAPAKRPRTRRKAKPDPSTAEAQAD